MKTPNLPARVVNVLVSIAILGLMVHVVLDVALRHLAGVTIHGTIDYVSFWWMAPMVLLSLTSAEYAAEHIQVAGFTTWFSTRMQRVFRRIAYVLTIGLTAAIGWFGALEALRQWELGEYSGATGVLIWPGRLIVPIAALSFIIATVIMWRHYEKHPEDVPDPDQVGVGE